MDCLQAQGAISEALDGATSDAAVLAEARVHCQECEECLSFVRTLNVVKNAPLPEPPVDLADRVMATVRAEAAANASAATAAATVGAAVVTAPGDAADGTVGPERTANGPATVIPISTRLKRTRPSVLAAWAGAAAVLLVGVGFVGVMGIRMMNTPPTSTTANLANAPRDSASSGQAQPPAAESALGGAAKVAEAPESDFIVFNGSVYALVGPSTVQISRLRQLGITKSALDGADSRNREVMGADTMTGVYVLNDQGKLLEFQPVTRKYAGQTYQLKSGEVAAFGDWPVLPDEFEEPASENGSPTFTAVGADSIGLTVYRLTKSAATEGIAVGPGAPEGDPVAGSPNWSWWAATQ